MTHHFESRVSLFKNQAKAAPILGFGKYREKTILEVVNEARGQQIL